jgi:hypothetical protein
MKALSQLTTSEHYSLGDDLPSPPSPVHSWITFEPLVLLSEHLNTRGYSGNDLSEGAVMNMMPPQLYSLRFLVHNLEVANSKLQTQLFGDDTQHERDFAVFSKPEPPSRATIGSYSYRNMLYEQYIKMLAIARKPDTNDKVPTTPTGARILQEYRKQLQLLAQSQTQLHKNGSPVQHSPLQVASRHGSRQSFKIAKTTVHPHQKHGPRSPLAQNTALQDYQMQLAILEFQNQKRLELTWERERAHFPPLNFAGREIVPVQDIDSQQKLLSADDYQQRQTDASSTDPMADANKDHDQPRGRPKLRTDWI